MKSFRITPEAEDDLFEIRAFSEPPAWRNWIASN